jgi:hypothetical protein
MAPRNASFCRMVLCSFRLHGHTARAPSMHVLAMFGRSHPVVEPTIGKDVIYDQLVKQIIGTKDNLRGKSRYIDRSRGWIETNLGQVHCQDEASFTGKRANIRLASSQQAVKIESMILWCSQ